MAALTSDTSAGSFAGGVDINAAYVAELLEDTWRRAPSAGSETVLRAMVAEAARDSGSDKAARKVMAFLALDGVEARRPKVDAAVQSERTEDEDALPAGLQGTPIRGGDTPAAAPEPRVVVVAAPPACECCTELRAHAFARDASADVVALLGLRCPAHQEDTPR